MPESSRLERWADKWVNKKTNWHMSQVNPFLERHYSRMCPGDAPVRILVPLCGKTLDMVWLYEKGHTVIGIEGVEEGITQFFAENNLEFSKSATDTGHLFQTADGRLQIYHSDLFALGSELVGPVQAIWDRGSYVAINVEDRPKYAEFLRAVMAPDCKYLLWAVDYDPALFSGPPHCLTSDHIGSDFGASVKIEPLERVRHTSETWPRLSDWNLKEASQVAYLITPK